MFRMRDWKAIGKVGVGSAYFSYGFARKFAEHRATTKKLLPGVGSEGNYGEVASAGQVADLKIAEAIADGYGSRDFF